MENFINSFMDDFHHNFIADDRWKYLTDGLLVTLKLTLFATLIGIVIGIVVAMVRSAYDLNGKKIRNRLAKFLLSFANIICKIYLTVIRGTPVVVQLLIMYFVVFSSSSIDKVVVGIIVFGINSGAYVTEIIRSGIMSIDKGQLEAGRSLGFNYVQTMRYIIIPQAIKNVIPPLANEFIVLLKETSVAGYIALQDLTKGGTIIQSRTYDPFMPLIAVALIYLVMVIGLTALQGRIERRFQKRDH